MMVNFQFPDGKEVRATFENATKTPYFTNRILKCCFNRFINGRPNIVNIPIHLAGLYNNKLISQFKCEYAANVKQLKVWAFDDDYPRYFEFNVENIGDDEPIHVKDFEERFLPDNLYLHKDMKNIWNRYIFKVFENENAFYFKRQRFEAEETIDNVEVVDPTKLVESNRSANPKSPKIPLLKANSKIITQTKDKGSTDEAIKGVLETKHKAYLKNREKAREEKRREALAMLEDDEEEE
jgi:hypothetical protein